METLGSQRLGPRFHTGPGTEQVISKLVRVSGSHQLHILEMTTHGCLKGLERSVPPQIPSNTRTSKSGHYQGSGMADLKETKQVRMHLD